MDTLAEGWRYLNRWDREVLHQRKGRKRGDKLMLPFTRITEFFDFMALTPTGHPRPYWNTTRRKLKAMLCNDYLMLEELKDHRKF